jgi:hypothetical protein
MCNPFPFPVSFPIPHIRAILTYISLLLVSRCSSLGLSEYRDDTLILAGDVSDDVEKFRATLKILKATFAHVFFVPGNHELWVREADRHHLDSMGEPTPCCFLPDLEDSGKRIEVYWQV